MAKYLSKIDEKIVKEQMQVHITHPSNNRIRVSVNYPAKAYNTRAEVTDVTGSMSFYIDESPTANCQMGAFRAFYGNIQGWKDPKLKGMNEVHRFNIHMKRLAFFKGVAAMHYTSSFKKRLFFIDIRKEYVKAFKNMNKYLFKRRNKSREVHYTSTNGNGMMYTVVELDTEKLAQYI